jgi:hypothetical protein
VGGHGARDKARQQEQLAQQAGGSAVAGGVVAMEVDPTTVLGVSDGGAQLVAGLVPLLLR